jgi:kynurenine formamidase
MRASILLLGVAAILSACAPEFDPMHSEVVDPSPVITEDLPARIMGTALSATRPYTVVNPFGHLVREAEPYAITNSLFTLLAHGGPHVDAEVHIFPDGRTVQDYSVDQFVGPLKLLDVRHLPTDSQVPLSIVESQGVRPRDVAILFGDYEPPTADSMFPTYQHFSRAAAEYLAMLPVRAFGTDGWSVDARGTGLGPIVHEAFLPRGIPVIEQLTNLQSVPSDGWVLFVGLPLNVAEANGAPLRAAAFVYR